MACPAQAAPRRRASAGSRQVLSVMRSAAASPATGSARAPETEQKTLIHLALKTNGSSNRAEQVFPALTHTEPCPPRLHLLNANLSTPSAQPLTRLRLFRTKPVSS
jgi:hypothetical protein